MDSTICESNGCLNTALAVTLVVYAKRRSQRIFLSQYRLSSNSCGQSLQSRRCTKLMRLNTALAVTLVVDFSSKDSWRLIRLNTALAVTLVVFSETL